MVRERAVVHEAQVEAGRERVRVLGRDAALGRHARVSERVAALHVVEPEALREPLGPAHLLVDLDGRARAHHAQLGVVLGEPRDRIGGLGGDAHDAVARAHVDAGNAAECRTELTAEVDPVVGLRGGVQRELRPTRGSGVTVDRDPCAIGPSVAELDQHGGQVCAQPFGDGRRFREQTNDSAHRSLLALRDDTSHWTLPELPGAVVHRATPAILVDYFVAGLTAITVAMGRRPSAQLGRDRS